ncbi:uncharacterized protein F5147DRAFT_652021 [Suillus discolor]|uniref:Uncharacterized protein n=1 Tax=Suillus discolor TaxID=1912936 RepID=A0A9P7JUX2_9AGAM|nr:uncharacterized protein F5147DRAFT_652021 [Suillus discolor]KAG2109827.1 hypothetical protein F5147DRAFT_652021 [Suillus discolor]
MSSIIFNPSMLTASPSPSPSPKPEERPLEGGNVSIDDTTIDDAAPKEPEESESDRVERAWAAMLNTMRVCVDTAPPSKLELLEEQESWLRDWNVVMGKIATRTLTRAMKAWKEKVEESAVTARLACTDKGKGKEVVATEEKTVEKARLTATSSGCQVQSSFMQAGSCEACIKARKGCSFVAAKNKGRAPAAPKLQGAALHANDCTRRCNDKYHLALLDMHQHMRIQESELLHMSNWLYILAHDWGNWEKELGEVLKD